MTLRIIQDHEIENEFQDKIVLIDMGEPNLFAIRRDPSFLMQRVSHEYVCFDARHGEVVKIDDEALNELQRIISVD